MKPEPLPPPPAESRIISAASLLSFSLLFAICGLQAQVEPVISRILERGPHYRIVEFTRTMIDTNGAPYTHVGQYTEIGNGLHYPVDGEWLESEEIIEPHPLGAAAQRGLYRVLFHANLNRPGAIEIEMPGGQLLRNHPLGIYATDASDGRSLLIGQLKDSIGVLLPPNEVIYADAFEGIQADMIYRYGKGRFEASVVLREQPSLPRGFEPESTWIELATEFLEPPRQIIDRAPPAAETDDPGEPVPPTVESVDPIVDFGDMQMVRGAAFLADADESDGALPVPVDKRWLVIEGRQVLFERVPLTSITPLLESLPNQQDILPQQAAAGARRILPKAPSLVADSLPMLLARAATKSPGFVIDYILVVSSPQNNFHSGPTFVVNSWVYLNDWTWIQNGAIIKFAPDSGIKVNGYLLSPGWGYSRAILTSKQDDSVGEPVSEPPHIPTQQNHTALYLDLVQPVADLYYHYPGKIQRLEIRYAGTGIHDCSPNEHHQVWNNRFYDCDVGVIADNTTVTIDDVIMCGMPYEEDRYQEINNGTVIVGGDDIAGCGGFDPPEIDTQPIGGAVSAGGYKQFIVLATGKCLLYQWYFNGVSIPGANHWSYPIQQVQLAHAGEYHVVVRNDKAFVTSARVTLTVNNSPPQIYQQPLAQKIRTGGTARFAVGAAPVGVTYQWFKNGSLMTGKDKYELVLPNVSSGDATWYKVRVRHAGVDLYSQQVALQILSAGSVIYYPQITASGILINLVYTNNSPSVPPSFQLNSVPKPLPFLNVPCSGHGTLARIDVNTGRILGEYATGTSATSDPSRTAVDRNGNVWVANRGPAGAQTVTKFGVVVGGIRGTYSGTFSPNPNGEYLSPPFVYSTCPDRNGDALIRTSRGLTDILPWPNDEMMTGVTVPWPSKKPRLLAVDKDDNVWVGGGVDALPIYPYQPHQKFNGHTGAAIGPELSTNNYGGYGGFMDGTGYLWSAGGAGQSTPGLLRANVNSVPYSPYPLGNSHGNYGIAIDPKTQRVWYGFRDHYALGVYNSSGTWFTDYYYPSPYPRGMVIDFNNNVWVANSADLPPLGKDVTHLRTDGTVVGNVDLMFVPPAGTDASGCQPTGLAVDSNGKVWVANRTSDNVMRIDPNAGPEGRGTHKIGAVDLTVDLGLYASPYAFSDMTGFVTLGSTFRSGSWAFVHDEGVSRVWTKLSWTGYTPSYTWINAGVRAANSVTALPNLPFQPVVNGQAISGVTGRYLEVRVTLHGQYPGCPRVESLTIYSSSL